MPERSFVSTIRTSATKDQVSPRAAPRGEIETPWFAGTLGLDEDDEKEDECKFWEASLSLYFVVTLFVIRKAIWN